MRLWRRIINLFRRKRVDAEIEAELRSHLEMAAEDGVRSGMNEEEARRAARLRFGNPQVMRERTVAADMSLWLEGVWRDVKYALRQLRKSPGFAATAVLTLALGIGATTTVFSIVNCVLLKPFPFHNSVRLVMVHEATRNLKGIDAVNYQHYLFWKKHTKTVQEMALFIQGSFSVATGSGHPRIVSGLSISPDFFSVLDVQPALGRTFRPIEATEGHNEVIMLSWGAWQKYFDGDKNAIGKTLMIGGIPRTVVGVLPRGFRFPHVSASVISALHVKRRRYEIFNPAVPDPSEFGDHNYSVIARLRPGVTAAQAQSELGALEQRYFRAMGRSNAANMWAQVRPLLRATISKVSAALWLSLAAAGVVLLIGCINLASLQLARAVVREREMAVRAVLGAGRGRLLWATLRENLLLALAGGALGVLAAAGGVRLFVAAAPAGMPRLSSVQVSWPVLVGALGLSVATALLFGLVPAIRSLRIEPQSALKTKSQNAASTRAGERARNMLVAGEVACTVGLLILCGLLLRSLSTVLTQHRDFDASHLTLVRVDLNGRRYDSGAVRASFMGKAMSRLRDIPSVQSVALTSATPLTGNTWVDGMFRPDRPTREGEAPIANMRWVSPSYVSTLRIPLLEGRDLKPSDRNHPTNVLISQRTAREVWPHEDAVGRTFKAGGETYTVVGVVANARINSLKNTENMVYVPYWGNPWWWTTYLIRSPLPASSLAPLIRRAIWKVDPEVAIPVLKSMDAQIGDSVAAQRFQTWLLTGFGGMALLLALLGIYGTLAYSVSLRRHEFGIRMALGSDRAALMRFVVGRAIMPVLVGLMCGVALGLVAARWVRSLLYHTPPADPVVVVLCVSTILLASLLASFVPARRAAGIDPMQVLRME